MECHKGFERCSRLFQHRAEEDAKDRPDGHPVVPQSSSQGGMAEFGFLQNKQGCTWIFGYFHGYFNFNLLFFFLISGVVSPPNFHRISCVYKFVCWFFGCFPPFRRRIWGFFEQKNQGDGPGRFDIFTKLAAAACQSSCLKSCWHKTPQPMGR